MNNELKLKGHIAIKVTGADGTVKHQMEKDNVVVTVGKTYLAAWLAAASQADKFMSYVDLGSGSTAAAAADTIMQTSLGARVIGTLSSTSNTWQNVSTFAAGASTGTVAEAGLFSASTAGTMLAHQVFTGIPKGADDSLELTWTITLN